jgi:hypothetical protein
MLRRAIQNPGPGKKMKSLTLVRLIQVHEVVRHTDFENRVISVVETVYQ